MLKPYSNGQHIYFASTVHARATASPTASSLFVPASSKGVVVGYSKEETEEISDDDFVAIKITDGAEHVGQTVWVSHDEFGKLHASY